MAFQFTHIGHFGVQFFVTAIPWWYDNKFSNMLWDKASHKRHIPKKYFISFHTNVIWLSNNYTNRHISSILDSIYNIQIERYIKWDIRSVLRTYSILFYWFVLMSMHCIYDLNETSFWMSFDRVCYKLFDRFISLLLHPHFFSFCFLLRILLDQM